MQVTKRNKTAAKKVVKSVSNASIFKYYPALSNLIEYISIIVSKVGILYKAKTTHGRNGIKIFKPMIDEWI